MTDVSWERAEVVSPRLAAPVSVVAAVDMRYVPGGNRLQNLSLYLPATPATEGLVGTPVESLPGAAGGSELPRFHVHVHGGAWRDPQLTARSIEPTVACAFAEGESEIAAIASIDYTVSQFPTHPTLSYDAVRDGHSDPAREAIHPQHLADVLRGLALLGEIGLDDGSYILSGHSCGACLAFQAALQSPAYFGLDLPEPPSPAAMLGLNGLYDLPDLVDRLGTSHAHLGEEYQRLLTQAFGPDRSGWAAASPPRFDPATVARRAEQGREPRLVVLDQSAEDQLVPVNQRETLTVALERANLRVVEGHRCTGEHAAPWQQGTMVWGGVRDVLGLLAESP